MPSQEYFQKLADEFCREKGIPPADIKIVNRTLPLTESTISWPRTIEVHENTSENVLKHELKHYHILSKTKYLSTVFSHAFTPWISFAGVLAGELQKNNYLFGLSDIFWTGHWLIEAYCDYRTAKLRDLIIDLGYLSVPYLPKIIQAIRSI